MSWVSQHQSGSQLILSSSEWEPNLRPETQRILWLEVLLLSPLSASLPHLSGTFSCPRPGSQNILVLTIVWSEHLMKFPISNFYISRYSVQEVLLCKCKDKNTNIKRNLNWVRRISSVTLLFRQKSNCQAQAQTQALRHSGSLRLTQALTLTHSGSYSVTVTVTRSLGWH